MNLFRKRDRLYEDGIPIFWIILFIWLIWPDDSDDKKSNEPPKDEVTQTEQQDTRSEATLVQTDTTKIVSPEPYDLDAEYTKRFPKN